MFINPVPPPPHNFSLQDLRRYGALAIHGDKDQREREYALNQFKQNNSNMKVSAIPGLTITNSFDGLSWGSNGTTLYSASPPRFSLLLTWLPEDLTSRLG